MTLELINVGNAANDGTGDDLREAFIKVNNNFITLNTENINDAANIGNTGAGVFANISNGKFNFKKLVAGTNISIAEFDSTIVFNSAASIFTITGDTGSLIAGGGVPINIVGGDAITVGVDENTKTITVNGGLFRDPNPTLSANMNADNFNIENVGILRLTQIGEANYQERLGRYIEGFDFGNIVNVHFSILDFVIAQVGVDFGTFSSPNPGIVDLGTIV